MPVEYQRALTGLKARYGVTATMGTKKFGAGAASEPRLFLAIPPPPKGGDDGEDDGKGKAVLQASALNLGEMSVKIADLTVNGSLTGDDGVMEEVMRSREVLRSSSVQESVVSKARAKAAGISAKNR